METINQFKFYLILLSIGIASISTSCQRCYTCTGEITSTYINPFTGETITDTTYDEQSFCGTGKLGTRDALATMESNGYICVRTD